MKLFRFSCKSIANPFQISEKVSEGVVATIGSFDGLHLGHQAIITELKKWANLYHAQTLVLSFYPAPKAFFNKAFNSQRLMRLREKYDGLNKWGIDFLGICRFDKQLANMTAADFVKNILMDKLKIRHIVIGEDFKFGKNREGDIKVLRDLGKKYHFEVTVLPLVLYDNEKISSTKIRDALLKGDNLTARMLLGN